MTQQTFGILTRPMRVRNFVNPPILPDEPLMEMERRRRERRAREALRRAQKELEYEEVDHGDD